MFLFDVMESDGLENNGCGIRAIQRVRLMHAARRQQVLADVNTDAVCETPISQQDMVVTLMLFAYVTLESVERLGQHVEEDADAWLHIWNVIGYLLGKRSRLDG